MKKLTVVAVVLFAMAAGGCQHEFIDISEGECQSDTDCADGDPCTVDICGIDRACVQVPVDNPACEPPPDCVPTDEVCNSADDDCDGETDEGLENMGPCGLSSEGECVDGHLMCSSGMRLCVDAIPAVDEICDDDLDNDCDGETDEGCGECETSVDCADGDDCTIDLCEIGGICRHSPSDNPACEPPPECGDGICNGSETCSDCSVDCGVCPIPAFATIRVSLPGGTPEGYAFAEAHVYYSGGEGYGLAPFTAELTMEQACGREAGVEVKFLLDGWEGMWCRFWLMQVELNGEVVSLPTIHHDWTFGGNLQISRTMFGCPADVYPDSYADDTPIANLNFTLDPTLLTPEQVADTEIVVFYHDPFYLGLPGYPVSDSFCRSETVGGSSLAVGLPWYDVCQREYDSGLYDGRPGWQDRWNTVWAGVRSRSTGSYNPYGVLGALRVELNGAEIPIAAPSDDNAPAILARFESDGDPDCTEGGPYNALRLRMARLLGSTCPAIDFP